MIILVSACLMGMPCRYDGQATFSEKLYDLYPGARFVPICPEVMGGLPTPRPPAEIVSLNPLRVANSQGFDVTQAFKAGALKTLEVAKTHDIDLAILKAKSPSCGLDFVYDGSFTGQLVPGDGLTAALLRQNGYHVISDSDLVDS